MTDEQINEVMRLVRDAVVTNSLFATEQIADMSIVGEAKYALETYLRTIGEPENTFPLNPNAASKWAHLQKHDGAEAIGVVFRTGSGSVGSLVDGRVVWADWLAHPNGGKPESVNAELLAIVHQTVGMIENTSIETGCCCCGDGMDGHANPMICGHSATDQGAYLAGLLYEDAKAAIARAESAIESSPKPVTLPAMKAAFRTTRVEAGEFIMAFKFRDIEDMDRADDEWRAVMAIDTPAKVSPCAGHAVQQEADEAGGA